MNDYLAKLNPKQLEACRDIIGPSLIVAGAGSGKTRVLTSRIAYMILENGISPMNILAITFTNKAAKEMKERLDQLIGFESNQVTCKTFHSFCAQILRSEIGVLNRKSNFQIIDDDDSLKLIKEAMAELNLDTKLLNPKSYYDYISALKARIYTIDNFKDPLKETVENVFNKYNSLLLQDNLVDFDDLMLLSMEIFENNPNILEKYQDRYRYILVDEFQDTSNIQYDFIRILGKKHLNVFIVGDEDQSIYSFRGANITNIRKFMKDFDGYNEHILDENYRSSSNILECANKLISNNKNRIKKDLWTKKSEGSTITFRRFDSDRSEARFVAESIQRQVKNGYNYKDFAVLYRNNSISRNFENAFLSYNIPYVVYSGLSFYKRMEVKDMIAHLRLIINPDDFHSFKRAINSPKRGIGEKTIEKIKEEFISNDSNLQDAVLNANISKLAKSTILEYFDVLSQLRANLDKVDMKEFFYSVYEKTSYKTFIESIVDKEEKFSRSENINELLNSIIEVESEGTNTETLTDFLDNITLFTDMDLESKDLNHVSLITMHSAKGLEFKNVYVVSLENDIIPGSNNTAFNIEEERRLLYVSITRAMDNLTLSHADSRFRYGSVSSAYPSIFLKEIIVKDKNKSIDVLSDNRPKKEIIGDIKTGEKVYHEMYKEGVVLGQIEGFYIIKFDNFQTPKKVIVNHPFLKKL